MRRHLAGETEQAKRDMARLAEVKARRDAAAK
jgi:Casein kinase substrate phosphoprotein PP28